MVILKGWQLLECFHSVLLYNLKLESTIFYFAEQDLTYKTYVHLIENDVSNILKGAILHKEHFYFWYLTTFYCYKSFFIVCLATLLKDRNMTSTTVSIQGYSLHYSCLN